MFVWAEVEVERVVERAQFEAERVGVSEDGLLERVCTPGVCGLWGVVSGQDLNGER